MVAHLHRVDGSVDTLHQDLVGRGFGDGQVVHDFGSSASGLENDTFHLEKPSIVEFVVCGLWFVVNNYVGVVFGVWCGVRCLYTQLAWIAAQLKHEGPGSCDRVCTVTFSRVEHFASERLTCHWIGGSFFLKPPDKSVEEGFVPSLVMYPGWQIAIRLRLHS